MTSAFWNEKQQWIDVVVNFKCRKFQEQESSVSVLTRLISVNYQHRHKRCAPTRLASHCLRATSSWIINSPLAPVMSIWLASVALSKRIFYGHRPATDRNRRHGACKLSLNCRIKFHSQPTMALLRDGRPSSQSHFVLVHRSTLSHGAVADRSTHESRTQSSTGDTEYQLGVRQYQCFMRRALIQERLCSGARVPVVDHRA